MKKNIIILLAAILFYPSIMANNGLIINELSQSNIHYVYIDYEFPDSWVELYNASPDIINLNGYAIGDGEKFSKAYVLPDTCIAPQGHLLVYCDKEETGLHTDFRIDSGKGSLYLFNPAGNIIDEISFAKMPAPDVAFGRVTDNSDEWNYMVTPTPGYANSGDTTSVLLPNPVFSEVGGLKNDTTHLVISLPEEELPLDVVLCVTLDGHEPLPSDSVTAPYELTIDTTTVVRAKLFSKVAASPLSQTHSYIYYQQASDNSLPVISIVTNHDYLYDEEWGILGISMEDEQNIDTKWRRPINIEYFTDGEAVFNQVGETRIHGNWSRRYAQRSLAVYANKRFGEKRFEATLWKDKPHVTEVKSFVLRNSGNDFEGAHIRDAFSQTLMGRHCDNLEWMAYQPCIYFINGEYKGIYDIRERSNEDYIEANYDGLEDIDMFENWYEKKAGGQAGLDSLFAAINDSQVTFEQIDSLVDLEEFYNNLIINSFITNTDYPFNNHVLWRNLTVENSKWEFIMKDMDRTAYEPFYYDYFKFLYDSYEKYKGEYYNLASACKLYTLILENEQLRTGFLERYIVYLGDFLRHDVAMNLLYEMKAEIDDEYYNHCSVYFDDVQHRVDAWNWHYIDMERWWKRRCDFMLDYLAEYFSLGHVIPVTINTNGATLKINNVPVTQEVFKGGFMSGLKMHLLSENSVNGYTVTITNADGTTTTREVESSEYNVYVNYNQAAITIVVNNSSRLSQTQADLFDIITDNDNITVKAAQPIEQVVLYDIMGREVAHDLVYGNNTHSMNVAHNGIYMVQVGFVDGSVQVEKIVVK